LKEQKKLKKHGFAGTWEGVTPEMNEGLTVQLVLCQYYHSVLQQGFTCKKFVVLGGPILPNRYTCACGIQC
jgi:hypothetical protein